MKHTINNLENLLYFIWVIFKKEFLVQLNTKNFIGLSIPTSLILIVLFSFLINPSATDLLRYLPGVIWLVFSLSGMLILTELFLEDVKNSVLDAILLSPIPREGIYYGKAIAFSLMLLILQFSTICIVFFIFNINFFTIGFIIIISLSTLGFSLLGTLLSAMLCQVKFRQILGPLLFFPLYLPIMISSVEASLAHFGVKPEFGYSTWIFIIIAYDILLFLLCPWAFKYVVEKT